MRARTTTAALSALVALAAGSLGVVLDSRSAAPGPSAPATTSAVTAAADASVPVETTPAADFVDSVGVNAHWHFTDTPYVAQYARVKQMIVDAGITRVRGDADRAADLFASGVRTTAVIDVAGGPDPARQVAALAPAAASGAVTAVEGPNEGDLFWTKNGTTYRGQPFPAGVVAWQKDLYAAVQALPAAGRPDVIAPSLGGTYWDGSQPYGTGTFTGSADYGSFHPYPGPNTHTAPTPYAGLDRYYWQSDFPSIALDKYPWNFVNNRPPYGDMPMVATETGYSTYRFGPSEVVQGRYTPRLFLEDYRLGIPQTYAYEFLDKYSDPGGGEREAHFGLVRHDLTPKPAYYAVQSLLRVMADSGTPGAAGAAETPEARIAVTPPAGYDPAQLHHVAVRKSDGTLVVALWHEVTADDASGPSKDPQQPVRQVEQPPMDVTVTLSSGADRATVQTIDDAGHLQDTSARLSGGSLGFSVPDRVTFLTVPPSGGSDPAPAVRVAGDDRVATSVAVSQDQASVTGTERAPAAVLAVSDDFPDAVAGGALARSVGGPLLLTPRGQLDDRVARELQRRVDPGGTVHLVGGQSALGAGVADAVARLGLQVDRVAGADRYATAAALRRAVGPRPSCDLVLASGTDFPDAASAAGLVTPQRPLLLTRGARLPSATGDVLRECSASGGGAVTAVGGPAASALESAGALPGVTVRVLRGADRYATAAKVLATAGCAGGSSRLVLTSGEAFPDAAVGATYGWPVLLTPSRRIPSDVLSGLSSCGGVSRLTVVGGSSAVARAVVVDAVGALAR